MTRSWALHELREALSEARTNKVADASINEYVLEDILEALEPDVCNSCEGNSIS